MTPANLPDYDRRPYWHATMPAIPSFVDRPPSTRNGGIFHPGLKLGRAALERRYGPELGREVFQAGVDAYQEAELFVHEEGIDCHLRRTGLAIMAWSRSHLPALTRELDEFRQAGLTGHMIEGDRVQEEIGSRHYPGGMVLEESSAIHPGRYFAGSTEAAVAAGVDLHSGVAARRLTRQPVAGGVVTLVRIAARSGHATWCWPPTATRTGSCRGSSGGSCPSAPTSWPPNR